MAPVKGADAYEVEILRNGTIRLLGDDDGVAHPRSRTLEETRASFDVGDWALSLVRLAGRAT